VNIWCRFVGHEWCWHAAMAWGFTHAPMCRRCGYVPLTPEEEAK